jgi:quinol monooxygenase YgiN
MAKNQHLKARSMGQSRMLFVLTLVVAVPIVVCCSSASHKHQNMNQMVRLAKIQIDPSHLENYKSLLREEIETSLRVEPGVLTLYAVSEKNNPGHITILEIYADTAAYQAHLKTPHFIKYKNGTMNMVQSLELVESDPLIPGMKFK